MSLTITPADLDALGGATPAEAGGARYAAVRAAVEKHRTATAVPDQLTLLAEIGRLAADWTNSHGRDASPLARRRRALLDRLQAETTTELTLLSDQRAHEIYLGNVKAGPSTADRPAPAAEEPDPEGRYRFGALKSSRDVTVSDAARKLADTHGLTEAERTAIRIYTGGDYVYINPGTANDLRWLESNVPALTSDGQHMPRPAVLQEGSTHAAVALAGLRKLPPHAGEAFRGARFTPERFATLRKDYAVGARRTLLTLTSASAQRLVALKFANGGQAEAPIPADATIAVLFVYAGAGGRSVRPFSQVPSEAEVLLLPGTELRVESFTEFDPYGEPAARIRSGPGSPEVWYQVAVRGVGAP